MKYGLRMHRGTLSESLATSKYISEKDFNFCKPYYKYYGFDQRCRQKLYIHKNFEHSFFQWLFIEYTRNEMKNGIHLERPK